LPENEKYEMYGILKRKSLNGSGLWKKVYAYVGNKKFKYYQDKTLRKLKGVIDFDKINCLVMIDDGEDDSFTEPKSFRIEVAGSK
jgi:hypothetical protein